MYARVYIHVHLCKLNGENPICDKLSLLCSRPITALPPEALYARLKNDVSIKDGDHDSQKMRNEWFGSWSILNKSQLVLQKIVEYNPSNHEIINLLGYGRVGILPRVQQ